MTHAPAGTRAVDDAPVHDEILRALRSHIDANRWEPGQSLPEKSLCEEFGVQATPLQEVFRILQAEGLLERRPDVGVVVTPLDPPDLANGFEVLMGFEEFAASKAALFRHPRTLGAIVQAQAAMKKALAEGNVTRYYDLNDEFHRALAGGANNAALVERHHGVMMRVRRARHRVHDCEPAHTSSLEQHNAIIGYALAGDEQGAGEAARVHVENIAGAVLSALRA